MFFDPLYFVFLAPGILLGIYAQIKLSSTFSRASEIPASSGRTGAETAELMLRDAGIHNVGVEPVPGSLSDHYSPGEKMLRLSEPVYGSTSLAALGVAAHEAGHAFQDKQNYAPLVLRNLMVPLASFGGNISWFLIMIGFLLGGAASQPGFGKWCLYGGIALFSTTVIFQVINLPVEFDASNRARKELVAQGLISQEEEPEVARVLNAAALTYVAGTLTSIMTLLYFLYRSGLIGGSRE